MKQSLFSLLFTMAFNCAFAGSSMPAESKTSVESFLHANFTIDMYDTVVFDISQSVMAGNQVSFPVYFISDDTINALDFSLVFDEANFSLDTIINLTTYLQPVYNLTMGILYFTSYSLQDIDHNTPLVSVRLNMMGHYLCSDDLDSIKVYLNGDPCSVKAIECISDEVSEMKNSVAQISVYPNPSSGSLNINPGENGTVELLDLNGSQVLFRADVDANRLLQINTTGIASGVYMVKLFNDNFVVVKKVIIN